MREVIALPQVVCGVERYAHTEKRNLVTMIKDIFVFHYHYILFMLSQKEMEKIEATQTNNNYGGLIFNGSGNNITIVVKSNDAIEKEQKKNDSQNDAVESSKDATPYKKEVGEEESKEDLMQYLIYLTNEAIEIYGTPREILKPYFVAVSEGLVMPMNYKLYNETFSVNIPRSTFHDWTSPTAKCTYSDDELKYHKAKLRRFK